MAINPSGYLLPELQVESIVQIVLAMSQAGDIVGGGGDGSTLRFATQTEAEAGLANEFVAGPLSIDQYMMYRRGVAGGYPYLGGDAKILSSFLPASVTGGPSFISGWNANTNTPTMPAASSKLPGQYYKVTVAGTTLVDGVNSWGVGDILMSNGVTWEKFDNSETVSSVNAQTGAVVLTKASVGLANAENTADIDKVISTLTANALSLKANAANAALTGVPTAPTAAPGTNNTQIANMLAVNAAVSGVGLGYQGVVANQAAMLLLTGATAGSECYRTDTGTYWKLRIAGYSVLANWDNTGVSAGASTGGDVGGGGGSDRTSIVAEADPVLGGFRPASDVVNGVPHQYGYAAGRMISDGWSAAGLSRIITYDSNGFGIADTASNYFSNWGQVISRAQAITVKSELVAKTDLVDQVTFLCKDLEDAGTGKVPIIWDHNTKRFYPAVNRRSAERYRGQSTWAWAKSRGLQATYQASGVDADTAIIGTSTKQIAGGTPWSSVITSIPAVRHQSASPAANLTAGWTNAYWRCATSNNVAIGGFDFVTQFSKTSAGSTTVQLFAGLFPTALVAETADIYTNVNFIAIMAKAGTDTNLQMCCRAASGAVTKVNLGASFPAFTTAADFYVLGLRHVPAATQKVYWTVVNLVNGAVAQGVFTSGVDTLPVLGTNMYAAGGLNSGSEAVQQQIDFSGFLTGDRACEYLRDVLCQML